MAKNCDKAPRPAFLLSTGKHRISPLHPPDLLRKALASPQEGCVGIERGLVRTGQAAGFQSFRMRTFKVGTIVVTPRK